ncbi:MAG TPA: phospholipase D-like domain-containing protein [bacterium]|nr:phospholipase D-like domain-containing protein [bacterium]
MPTQAPSFKDYLRRRQEAIDSEQSHEKPKADNLYNEKTFYRAFIKDMLEAKQEVIIYSPFVSKFRTDFLKDTVERLRDRNIEVFIFTRPVDDYDSIMQPQIQVALDRYGELGVCVFYLKGFIHEKVAVIDRKVLWEGSLNILSQRASREMMRRTANENSAVQVISYLELGQKLSEGYKLRYEKLCRSLMIDSRQNTKLKIKIFLSGLLIPIIGWCFFAIIGGASTLPQVIKLIASMVRLSIFK